MAKRVFFSFHYKDVETFRANVVRKHSLLKETGTAGFFDASIWEDAELHGDSAVKSLINDNLINTSVTCVLIGSETWERRWVQYEIMKSHDRGNKLFGIHINGIKDKNGQTFENGSNPFSYLGFYINSEGEVKNYQVNNGGTWRTYSDLEPTISDFDNKYRDRGYVLSSWVPVHDWTQEDGYVNFAKWVEEAE